MDDLVERLDQQATLLQKHGQYFIGTLLDEAAAEIRSLREQVAQERADRQAAILEGMEIMREAAAVRAGKMIDGQMPTRPLMPNKMEAAIRNLDPAAILAAHTRAEDERPHPLGPHQQETLRGETG